MPTNCSLGFWKINLNFFEKGTDTRNDKRKLEKTGIPLRRDWAERASQEKGLQQRRKLHWTTAIKTQKCWVFDSDTN